MFRMRLQTHSHHQVMTNKSGIMVKACTRTNIHLRTPIMYNGMIEPIHPISIFYKDDMQKD